jgi:two-component sensor histidine kinase
LNELVTNAVRHAFPDGRKGRIEITLTERPESFDIEIGDDGIGSLSAPPPRSSLGLRLVNRLSAQLNAELTRVERPGTHYRLRLPREPKR